MLDVSQVLKLPLVLRRMRFATMLAGLAYVFVQKRAGEEAFARHTNVLTKFATTIDEVLLNQHFKALAKTPPDDLEAVFELIVQMAEASGAGNKNGSGQNGAAGAADMSIVEKKIRMGVYVSHQTNPRIFKDKTGKSLEDATGLSTEQLLAMGDVQQQFIADMSAEEADEWFGRLEASAHDDDDEETAIALWKLAVARARAKAKGKGKAKARVKGKKK